MILDFTARIDGPLIRCLLGSDCDLTAPVWCFSMVAPAEVVSGGTMIRAVAGYCEVQLPDLVADHLHEVVLRYANADFAPANRAWLPLGGYLRRETGICTPLPTTDQGVHVGTDQPLPAWDGLRLIPQPSQWAPGSGTLMAPGFACEAESFMAVDALSQRLTLPRFVDRAGVPVRLQDDPTLPAEGYVLTIGPNGITVCASDRGGFFHAAITLLNLRQTHATALPCGVITDAPRFGWRGQHLDCARHYYTPTTLHRLLDLMALFKLNRFHWHFADDEAFRLQVTSAPDLWKKTQYRGEGHSVPSVHGAGPLAGGSYTRTDVDALLAHAAKLNIQVLPEIEVPAHSFAMNLAIPGLRDPDDIGGEVSVHGYTRNVVNPAMPATWDLLHPLAAEVAAMFPIGILHLGCDELPEDSWAGSPAVDRLKAAHGLTTRDDVQGWMMAKLAAPLFAAGTRPAAWEEAAKGGQGGIGHDALLFSWTGQGPGIAAARAGHDVVMCPAQNVYFDMAHTGDPDDWGACWAAFVGLEDTVNWRVVPEGAEDVAHRIVGVQGTYWSEFTTDDRQIEPMLAPRILGLAAKAWEVGEVTDGPALRVLSGHYGALFDAIGWVRHRQP